MGQEKGERLEGEREEMRKGTRVVSKNKNIYLKRFIDANIAKSCPVVRHNIECCRRIQYHPF
jgi:hypothetical protein